VFIVRPFLSGLSYYFKNNTCR